MRKRSKPDLAASSRAGRSDTEPASVTMAAAAGTASGSTDAAAVSDFRISLTSQQLYAAAYFSRQVARLEGEHAGEGPGNFFFGELFHHAIACLFSAAAGLEAYTNGLFADRDQLLPNHDPLLLDQLWKLSKKQSVVDKVDLMLELRRKPKFIRRGDYWDKYVLIRDMRDAMLHYKAVNNSDENSKHAEISKKLAGKFDLSSFMPAHRAFPLGWATHGGTKWIVESVLSLIAEFERLLGLPPGPYTGAEPRLQA